MPLALTTTGTCRHCGGDLAEFLQPGQVGYWVHYLTRLPRCTTGTTTAEPVTLEVVR
ncbi:hypothetical protein [Crossiella sp. CA198]|uniref:hypothetical protein n=1 Tax=Crossiella sp. CA198 TaxID=3455607 RepID=UPI003F8CFE97